MRINAGDGDELMALISGNANLLVLKTGTAWMLYQSLDGYGMYPVGEDIGCVAKNTVVKTPIGTIWLGRNGQVWCYDGNTFEDIAKNRVSTVFDGIPAATL